MKKIYEIVARCTMFYGVGARGLLHRMVHIVGQLPPLWESYWALERPEDRGTLPRLFCSGSLLMFCSRRVGCRSKRQVCEQKTDLHTQL
jgi:hypothetical protein